EVAQTRPLELAGTASRASPLRQEGAVAVELLNAVVAVVRDVYVAGGIHRDPNGRGELPVAAAGSAPLRDEPPIGVEFLNAVVARIGDVDVAAIHRNAGGCHELPIAAAVAAPLRQERTGGIELLDAVVHRRARRLLVGDIDVPTSIQRNIGRRLELA